MSLHSSMDTGQIYSKWLKICHEIVGYSLAFAQFDLSFISMWKRTSLDRYPFVQLTKLAARCSDSFRSGDQIWMTSGEDAEWLDWLSTRATIERLDNRRHGPLNTLFLARIRTSLLIGWFARECGFLTVDDIRPPLHFSRLPICGPVITEWRLSGIGSDLVNFRFSVNRHLTGFRQLTFAPDDLETRRDRRCASFREPHRTAEWDWFSCQSVGLSAPIEY